MGWFNFSKNTSNDIGIDLGTVNTLICIPDRGIVLREPSVVAIDFNSNPPQVIEVGLAARDMIGRTPDNIKAIRPLRDGVIADIEWAEVMLKKFLEKISGQGQKLFGVRPGRVVIGVPCEVTQVEHRALGDAVLNLGARYVHLVDEPMAAAIGAGMPITRPTGCMIVDIGGGTTEIAVLSLNGIVVRKSIRIAGDKLTDCITKHLLEVHQLSIGERTAENIKIRLGSALPGISGAEEEIMEVRGLHTVTGLPATMTVSPGEIRECLHPTLMALVTGIKQTFEETPPELAADIVDRGIVLAGGGALLTGFDELVCREVDVPVHIASDPLSCVVNGTEKLLTDPAYAKILAYTELRP